MLTGGNIGDGGSSYQRPSRNPGPQHPAAHGVRRVILELEGEAAGQARAVRASPHPGSEKSREFRYWTRVVTFFTRAESLSPAITGSACSMAVGKLLQIEVP